MNQGLKKFGLWFISNKSFWTLHWRYGDHFSKEGLEGEACWRKQPSGRFFDESATFDRGLVVLSAPLKRRSPEGDRREPFSFFHLWTVMRFQGSFDLRPIVKQPIALARPQRLEGSRAQMDCDVDAQTSTCGFLSVIGVFWDNQSS